MKKIETVAFIGAGNMGGPMARRVAQAGFKLMICDRNPDVLDRFSKEGARTTTNPAECAGADAIIVLLANDQQILDVMLGEAGIAQAIPAGGAPVVCMMSTTLPDTLQAIKGPLEAAGARLVDAPVSGGIVGAERGTLSIMLGGEDSVVEAVTPLMEAMGQKIFHCGELGAGEVVKVINNMLCIGTMYLTAEAIELAQRNDVSFEKLAPILAVSTGVNFLTADADIGRAQYRAWANTQAAYESIHNIVSKDLHLALKLAEQSGLEPGLLKTVSQYVDSGDPSAPARWQRAGQTD